VDQASAATPKQAAHPEWMKFLIDECLHTSLVTLAHEAGHLCEHVNFVGLGGRKDWQLMSKIRSEGYTLVTNNRTDFVALYSKEELHAGLVIILPNVTPSLQRELFRAALLHIGERDLTKVILGVDLAGSTAICREYS
jgi:predicted nuclease of predicted toxin-antitoxin system